MIRKLVDERRRLTAGAAILGFVVALEVEDLFDPTNHGSTAERLHRVAEHPTRLVVAAALLFLSSALLIPTVISLRRTVQERAKGRRLMAFAAAVWTVGALGHAAAVGYYAVLAAAAGHRTPQVVQTLGRADHGAVGAIVGVGIACFALGCLLTVAALVRSGVASRWALLAVLGGVVGQPLGRAIGVHAFDLGQLAAVSPLVWVGWRIAAGSAGTRPALRAGVGAEPALES